MQITYDTVAIYLSMTFLAPAVVFLALGRSQRQIPALGLWSAAFFSLFASTILISLRGPEPGWFMLVLPNLLVGLGYFLGIAGLRSIKGLSVMWPVAISLLALFAAGLITAVIRDPSWSARVAVVSAGITAFSLCTVAVALMRFGRSSRLADLLIMLALGINALIAALRATSAVMPDTLAHISTGTIESLFFFWTIASALILAIALYLQFHVVAETELQDRVTTLARLHDDLERTVAEQAGMKQILIHELRRPINQIATTLDVMGHDANRPPSTADIMQLKRLSQGAGAILDEIADLVQLRDLIDRPDRHPVHIGELAEDIALKWSVPVQVDPDLARQEAAIDPLLFDAAVGNVIANGLRHGGTCRVVLHADADRLMVDVIDDGPGIAPQDWTRVWEKFTQLGDMTTPTAGRVGVGLYLARSIARAHDGEASVVSQTPSVVRLTFGLRGEGPADAHK